MSSLVDGTDMFDTCPSLTEFNGDLSSLVDGNGMFNGCYGLTSFVGDLSSLVNGSSMFFGADIPSFVGDLSSLVDGSAMFHNVLLTPESIGIIIEELPNKADIPVDDEGKHEYVVLGETKTITASRVCSLGIYVVNIDTWSDADKAHITSLFEQTANERGWTFDTNADLGGTYVPTVTAADGSVQTYIYAIKHEADEKTGKYVDANGKYWTVRTAEAIIGPNVQYWSIFPSLEDALTEWGLSVKA